jgi:hypothetical protein
MGFYLSEETNMLKRLCVVNALMGTMGVMAQETPKPGVTVLPYPVCREVDGEQLCVNASIAASTKEGRSFAADSDCSTVRTQRPFRPLPAKTQGAADDPRLQDAQFMQELNWVKGQIFASACSCCHDTSAGRDYAAWDINGANVWTEQMTNRALAIMAGSVRTDLMGTYPAEENFGFDRSQTGSPTTDVPRMKAFFQRELDRRGVTAEEIAKFPSANGPFEAVQNQKPTVCADGLGVDAAGRINWGPVPARYVYVTRVDAPNPLTPPKGDLPPGTLWRLDVLPSRDAITAASYGVLAEGSRQGFPANGTPEELQDGQSYRLYATRDILRPIVNCTFTYTASRR